MSESEDSAVLVELEGFATKSNDDNDDNDRSAAKPSVDGSKSAKMDSDDTGSQTKTSGDVTSKSERQTTSTTATTATSTTADSPPELVDEKTTQTTAEPPASSTSSTTKASVATMNDKRHACQIVSIVEKKKKSKGSTTGGDGNDREEDDTGSYAFHFEKERLAEIMSKVPPYSKIVIISVVGAFRTGKSFLLSWFLRYLHTLEESSKRKHPDNTVSFVGGVPTTGVDGATTAKKRESNVIVIDDEGDGERDENDKEPWYKAISSLGNEGFDWRAGSERNTTGIWMWSHPYLIQSPRKDGSDEGGGGPQPPIAVLLVDTQGMFDHETTMKLTASIFGFSTLLSSYQIYNVDKRIQEDNLQQLALFSEYARAAVESEKKTSRSGGGSNQSEEEAGDDDNNDPTVAGQKPKQRQPFQHIEFLVRDWQHFDDNDDDNDDEDDDDASKIDYAKLQRGMEDYLDKVLKEREARDLKETREQILTCFEKISCYGLCHPGFAVTKKKYSGNVRDLEEMFLRLLDRYCRKVFSHASLRPKTIHGRELVAAELMTYIDAYARLFTDGSNKFPEAATMLAATESANNTNAVHLALMRYKEIMDRVAGPMASNYLRPEELEEEHAQAERECLQVFSSIACFGSKNSIRNARDQLRNESQSSFRMYNALNDGRNPFLGLETYVIPAIIGFAAFILEWAAEATCSPYSNVCKAASNFFNHTYAVLFCFLGIVAFTKAKHIQEFIIRLKKAVEVLSDAPPTSSRKMKAE